MLARSSALEAGEAHLGARGERLGALEPGVHVLVGPVAAVARQVARIGEARGVLADRLAEHAVQVRTVPLAPPWSMVWQRCTWRTIASPLAASPVASRVARPGPRPRRAFFDHALDRVAHLVRPVRLVGLEILPLTLDRPRATMPANKAQPAMVLKRSFIERICPPGVAGLRRRSSVEALGRRKCDSRLARRSAAPLRASARWTASPLRPRAGRADARRRRGRPGARGRLPGRARGQFAPGGARMGPRLPAAALLLFRGRARRGRVGRAGSAIIPIENSQHGRVADIHFLLPDSGLSIIGEHFLPIHYALMGLARGPFKAAYSHPQALGQSRRFLRERGIVPLAYADTAGAAALCGGTGRSRGLRASPRRMAADSMASSSSRTGVEDAHRQHHPLRGARARAARSGDARGRCRR